jgi:hypothetical protein
LTFRVDFAQGETALMPSICHIRYICIWKVEVGEVGEIAA